MATATKKKTTERAKVGRDSRYDLSPVYAVVGVADFAVAALREVPGRVTELGDQVQKRVTTLQKEAREIRVDAPSLVKTLGGRAQHYAAELAKDAGTAYGGLVRRGELLVRRVARQPEVVELEEQAKAATAKVKAARTTARKSADAATRAAKGAVTSVTKAAEAVPGAVEGAADVTGVKPVGK